MQHGNLREYIRRNPTQLNDQVRGSWVRNSVSAVAFIHEHSVIHGEMSARNFLVADDLSLKLCDFVGSEIGSDKPPLITEEDRYRKSPNLPRSVQTDLFALGCLMYEIMVGKRPYKEDDHEDWENIAEKYERGVFSCLRGFKLLGRTMWDVITEAQIMRFWPQFVQNHEDGSTFPVDPIQLFLGNCDVSQVTAALSHLLRSPLSASHNPNTGDAWWRLPVTYLTTPTDHSMPRVHQEYYAEACQGGGWVKD
ncbi:kinase-like protein [Aspergillus saccharolyticus JOP 1030-1]|uniref:Kinase-like protein n=1 Tax=Aspergillus saccharolyticus JOP 1030-1 TaxID=1450539 RepID=A0A318ZIP6_9EURO|nr:kinase-like protein [Aspergillus saccharolyticus JOP 1030-1]PYH40118.1 kinase-like protein [Aspergillus saccharolyticus JOP 1030-1]